MSLKFNPPGRPPTLQHLRFETCAAVPLRLVVGLGFLLHGWAKLARGPEFFIGTLDGLHVPLPALMAWVTILVELLGGCAILAGAFVAVASVPLAITVLVAIFTVHLPYGFSSIKLLSVTAAGPKFGPPGYEVALFYLAGLAALVIGGPGPWSVDGFIARGRAWNSKLQE
jgi:putative oxidoreductase